MEPLAQLATIFNDEEVPLRRRIEAAALVLQHEASEELTSDAAAFLSRVSKSDVVADYRIDAIKALAKRQVPKATSPETGGSDPAQWREGWIRRVSDERRAELLKLGLWPPPPGWMSDLTDPNWVPPEGPPYGPLEVDGMAEKLKAHRMKLKAEGKL